jgi:hypothetical protein
MHPLSVVPLGIACSLACFFPAATSAAQTPAQETPAQETPAKENPAQEATTAAAAGNEPATAAVAKARELPPLPEGVTELKFAEIFGPIGPRGLEYTDKAKALEGKRVRILGYMVKTCRHDHGRFMLTPFPVTLHDHENGPADDLPASTVFVDVPPFRRALKYIPHEPGPFLLTGKLSLGGCDELHDRRSWVRLELERPARDGEARAAAASPAKPPTANPPAVREDVQGVDQPPAPTPSAGRRP